VSFANESPIGVFDVFESYEVFVVSIRAICALVLSIYFWKHTLSCNVFGRSGENLVGFCLGPIRLFVLY